MDDLVLSMPWVGGRDRWRWLLTHGESGNPLADFEVTLPTGDFEYAGFARLYSWLRWNAAPDRRIASEAELVDRVGRWIGRWVFGKRLGRAMVEWAPVSVRVVLPPELEFLAYRPLELSHVDGVPLARRDVSLVYELPADEPGSRAGSRAQKRPVAEQLRVLAVFSMPTDTAVLGLRRERFELLRLVRRLGARRNLAVECEVLQYGVTRQRLAERARDGTGWDVLHLSGHGLAGGLLLEQPDGSRDVVDSAELVRLLRPARARVKLAVVAACESGAASAAETLRWLRLDAQAEQLEQQAQQEANPPGAAAGGGAAAAGVARELATALDCAVLAMRYPVVDDFAVALTDRLYELLWESGQPVDAAARLAVPELAGDAPSAAAPPISLAVPALFGAGALGLQLRPPPAAGPVLDPRTARMARFPDEPARFVGRTAAMTAATTALAPESGRAGVVFHGMAGAGKTACAVELAYRHENAFAAVAFWEAPKRAEEWPTALPDLAQRLDSQLGDYGFTMVDKIGTVAELEQFLPRLTELLERSGVLLVLDNLETLLDQRGQWKDPRWAALITALTGHSGESRVVLTSRTLPAGLDSQRVLVLPVYALSLTEAALLARELPNLRRLLGVDAAGPTRTAERLATDRDVVRRILHVVQGHPKLLELADAATAHPDQLATALDAAEQAATRTAEGTRSLRAFFDHGDSALDPDRFLDVLTAWTTTTLDTLPGPPRLLLQILCCCEDDDRTSFVLDGNWADLWRRLNQPGDLPPIPDTLAALTAAALIHPETIGDGPAGGTDRPVRYRIHPGVAEAVRVHTDPNLHTAVDTELAAYWTTMQQAAIQRAGGEASWLVVHAGLAAAPYLLRLHNWDTAAALLERAMRRDKSPSIIRAVVPLLRRIAETTGEPDDEAVLAQALFTVDPDEAERRVRYALQTALARNDYRLASTCASQLSTLLIDRGRLVQALDLADQAADYTRRAGLGPWTQLLDECNRLLILSEMGGAEQVLTEIQQLRTRMATLPDQLGPNESVDPFDVRETILSIGHLAASDLGRWQLALDLTAEASASVERRDASPRELARTRFNDYGPLLRLGRLDDAQRLLLWCQEIFDDSGDTASLGAVFSARADLEDKLGHPDRAADLERLSLRYRYVQPQPEPVAVSHYNLTNYLAKAGREPAQWLAHRLAAAVLYWRTTGLTDRRLAGVARELRSVGERAVPASFAQLQARVEQVEGVRFGQLWAALAPDPGSGDDTLTQVLQAARDLPHDQG